MTDATTATDTTDTTTLTAQPALYGGIYSGSLAPFYTPHIAVSESMLHTFIVPSMLHWHRTTNFSTSNTNTEVQLC